VIHYHGTPITPNAQLMRMAGRCFCVSYARPDNLALCLSIGQSVMLDNGAFSAKTRGHEFDLPGFYAWLEPILAHPHWAVVPDVIDGTEAQQRAMAKTWPFRREFGIPVWHLGMPISYLLDLCNEWGRVCFGSAGAYWQIGTPAWCGRMDEAFNALVRVFGQRLPWVHGLRMLGQSAGPWPLSSADSTNVAQNYKRDTGCADCKAKPIDSTNPPAQWAARPTQEALCL
jgi:hypothetical protein